MLCKSIKFTTIPPQEQVVFMHIMPVAKINNIKHRNEKQNDLPEKLEAKKVDKQGDNNQKAAPKVETKPIEKPAEIEPKIVPTELSNPKPEKVLEPKPVEKTEPRKKPEPKPAETTKKEPAKQDKTKEKSQEKAKEKPKKKEKDELDLSSLEKSLTQSIRDANKEKASEGDKDKSKHKSGGKNHDNQTSNSSNYDENSQEAITVKALLQKRIESNWSKPSSMRDYENIKVRVHLKIDMNQNIQEISGFEFLNENAPENVKNVIKESIIRAIKLSNPFDILNIEDYEYWHDNWLIFSYR
jgi:hypothetical protein